MQQLVAQFLFYYFTVFAKDASSAAISGFFSLNSISNCNSQSINILNRPNRHGNLSNIIGTVIASVGWSL